MSKRKMLMSSHKQLARLKQHLSDLTGVLSPHSLLIHYDVLCGVQAAVTGVGAAVVFRQGHQYPDTLRLHDHGAVVPRTVSS